MATFFNSRRNVVDYFPNQVYQELLLRLRENIMLPYDEMMRLDAFITMWVKRADYRTGEASDPEGAREICDLVEAALVAIAYPTSEKTPHREIKGRWCSVRNSFLSGKVFTLPEVHDISTGTISREGSRLVQLAINDHQEVMSHKMLIDVISKKIENFTTHSLARALYYMEICREITIKKSGSDYLVIPVASE